MTDGPGGGRGSAPAVVAPRVGAGLPVVFVDLDGTVLRDRFAGRRAMLRAVADEAGASPRDPDRATFTGRTDAWITRELLRRALGSRPAGAGDLGGDLDAEAECAAAVRRVQARYLAALAEELARSGCDALAGALDLGAALARAAAAGRCRVPLLLTGNLREAARLKLAAAGLSFAFPLEGAFGDEHEDRTQVARDAAALAPGCRPVVLGAAPLDVADALAIGALPVLFGTGTITADVLAKHAPDAILSDLRDTEAVLEALFAGQGSGA